MILAAAEGDRSSFVDLDVPVWAWIVLLVLIVALPAILNTYLSLAIIVTMLIAAIVFSMRRTNRLLPRETMFDHAQND